MGFSAMPAHEYILIIQFTEYQLHSLYSATLPAGRQVFSLREQRIAAQQKALAARRHCNQTSAITNTYRHFNPAKK